MTTKYPWDELLDGDLHTLPEDEIDNFTSFRVSAYEAAKRRNKRASVIRDQDNGQVMLLAHPEHITLEDWVARKRDEQQGAEVV